MKTQTTGLSVRFFNLRSTIGGAFGRKLIGNTLNADCIATPRNTEWRVRTNPILQETLYLQA